jgi:hypothetical protein
MFRPTLTSSKTNSSVKDQAIMIRVRDVASTLLSLVWRAIFPVVGVGFLVGSCFKGDADQKGIEPAGNRQAVVSDQSVDMLVTMRDSGAEFFSTCIVQDEGGKELARINLYKDGAVTFEFGSTSPLRGCGVLSNRGQVDFSVMNDVKSKYQVSVQTDGSSVVDVADCTSDMHRILRLSPQGDVLRN